ncbi:tyrosine-protein kinase [Veronia nyctiphanis]|uniref:Tyrosine-protein kinase n=1 Tax=Veronia nyctiphanis TaxID=1278244 RepID=A0A4Q0YZS4_9GAMM|nr:polysaccharide biosynthesis tyrosine autokinase [Veronia nyctiphanis]RXJ74679.1 tyrosine-protein kinase [Veronia nyctiphanis]
MTTTNTTQTASDEIDLGRLFGILIDSRWMIISITFLFAAIGVAYAVLSTPIYKADALLQVEEKSNGMPALGEMGELFSSESSSSTEIEILKSRMVLGKTVDKFSLTTVIEPVYLPFIGKGIARLTHAQPIIDVARFTLPKDVYDSSFVLTIDDADAGKYRLLNSRDETVLTGVVGGLAEKNGFSLRVLKVDAENGTSFSITKRSRLDAIQWIQQHLIVSERGKKTGVLQLSFTGENKQLIEKLLDDIATNYFLQNVDRNSAEAQKSLTFLESNLPKVKQELTDAENTLNAFRLKNESVDLSLEAKANLDAAVKVEASLNQLAIEERDLATRFTKEHPLYSALIEKRKAILEQKAKLNEQTQALPKTQREVLRYTRDVEVKQQLYVELLNKVQELKIVKASTVGNVRILDSAQAFSAPIKPKKPLIAILATILGGILGVGIALLRAALHKGVENPADLEAIGLSVYASIPHSEQQSGLEKLYKRQKVQSSNEGLLAELNPADLSIEALRGLRTSLHFAMMEAKNNVLMISGPSPNIGKSFVSANLAAVMAKAGQKVLVIDADMRKGYLQKYFGINWENGLSDVLSGKATYADAIKPSGVENLDMLTRGSVPPNPSELLMHVRCKELIDWASNNYDLVIVDTPPVMAVTDPAIVGALAGTTLMVGRFGVNPLKEIEVSRERFEKAGVEVKGFILNAVERKASNAYGGNYGYYNYSYK